MWIFLVAALTCVPTIPTFLIIISMTLLFPWQRAAVFLSWSSNIEFPNQYRSNFHQMTSQNRTHPQVKEGAFAKSRVSTESILVGVWDEVSHDIFEHNILEVVFSIFALIDANALQLICARSSWPMESTLLIFVYYFLLIQFWNLFISDWYSNDT